MAIFGISLLNFLQWDYWYGPLENRFIGIECHCQQYLIYIVTVSYIGRRNQTNRKKKQQQPTSYWQT